MNNSIKTKIKKSSLFKFFRPLLVWAWKVGGEKIPPPHFVKQQAIVDYAKKFKINNFVETGTYYGDMIDAVKNKFKKIYSIELDNNLFELAQKKYSELQHIKIINGDSSEKMKDVLAEAVEPCLFWLDGHYSGPGTAKGSLDTPLLKELSLILSHQIKNHVILIDDAREFGSGDYPTRAELEKMVADYPDYVFEIRGDSARIYNKNKSL